MEVNARAENLQSLLESILILKQIKVSDDQILNFAIKSIDILQGKYIKASDLNLNNIGELKAENIDLITLVSSINNKAMILNIELLDCLSSRNISGVLNIFRTQRLDVANIVKYFKSQVAKTWFINNGYQ